MTLRRICIGLICLLVHPQALWAFELSETYRYSNRSGHSLESKLQMEIWDGLSINGTYFSNVRFKARGWQAGLTYLSIGGLTLWSDYSGLPSEQTVRAGGGAYSLAAWSSGEWGMTAEAAYTQMQNFMGSKDTTLTQWQATLSNYFTFYEKWDCSLALSACFYNLKLSSQIQAAYRELLQDREIQSLIFGDFLLYLLHVQTGYAWENFGYTGVIFESAMNWDNSLVYSGGILWSKKIWEPLSVSLSGQYSSRQDISASAGLSLNF
jgi:hypothetical protein